MIEKTYTVERTIYLDGLDQACIMENLYNSFTNCLGDYCEDDIDNIPGEILRDIFKEIALQMVKDEEFWAD